MKVLLSEDLKKYLHEHDHNVIVLKLLHTECCTGNINSRRPDVTYKEPHNPEDFETYTVDDFKVYIEKDVHAYGDTVEFIHESLLGKHSCHVKGLNLDNVPTM